MPAGAAGSGTNPTVYEWKDHTRDVSFHMSHIHHQPDGRHIVSNIVKSAIVSIVSIIAILGIVIEIKRSSSSVSNAMVMINTAG